MTVAATSLPVAHPLLGDDREVFADRLRAGLVLAFVGIGVFALADVALGAAALRPLIAIKLGVLAALVVALACIRTSRPREELRVVAIAVMAIVYGGIALTSIASGDATYTPLLVIAAAMTSAAMLPWGRSAQLVSVSIGLATVVAAFLTTTGDSAATAVYGIIGIAMACVASVYVASERERARSDRTRIARLLEGQTTILEMIALRRPLTEVLNRLSEIVEGHSEGLLCSVLLLEDGRLWNAAAPSLPAAYSQKVEGIAIGPEVGSCGTAAYHRRTVVVEDIATDPLWASFRDVAATHGLRACWSSPILATDGSCVGTFAMYYRERRGPDAHALYVLGLATHLAGIAITRARTEDALASSRCRLEEESQVTGALVQVGHEIISRLSAPEILARLCEITTELVGCDCSDTLLRNLDDDTYTPNSGHGYTADEWTALRTLEIPAEALRPLLGALERAEVVQVHSSAVGDPLVRDLLGRYGITVSLYVALRRGSEVIGILSCGFRGAHQRFTPVQERVARGIAHLASLALENARLVDELRSASQLKSEFVSTMSHELRTPLSVILGYTDMLEEDLPRSEQRRTLSKIRRCSLELLEMIETTLNLNRLETGKDPARFEPFDVGDLVDEIAGEYGAIERPLSTVLRWDVPEEIEVISDRRKLKIVLKNLIGNAIKFTPEGEVAVIVRADDERCTLVVRDTGVGIPSDHVPVIFEMFRQVDSSDSRSYSGVGLGLYIVRRLLTQLHGTIEVESVVGRGTAFTITLPRHVHIEQQRPAG